MKHLVLALPFLACSAAAAWADEDVLPTRMSLDDEERRGSQDVENDRMRPGDSDSLTAMEFIYRYSQLESGVLYTDYDSTLKVKSDLGFYVRYGVEVGQDIAVNMTYRFATFGNHTTGAAEDIRAQALFFGGTYHYALTPEFAAVGGLGIGPMWWDSSVTGSSIGFGVTAEAALTAKLWDVLRLKAGVVLDEAHTDFHQSKSTWSLNVSYLVGLEIGL